MLGCVVFRPIFFLATPTLSQQTVYTFFLQRFFLFFVKNFLFCQNFFCKFNQIKIKKW